MFTTEVTAWWPLWVLMTDPSAKELARLMRPGLMVNTAKLRGDGALRVYWRQTTFGEQLMQVTFLGVVSPELSPGSLSLWLSVEHPDKFKTEDVL